MLKTFLTTALGVVLASQASAFNEVANGDEIRSRLGIQGMSRDPSEVKVAVLDNGFLGYLPHKGMLPEGTEVVPAPLKLPETSSHGLGMAQILWEATGKGLKGPKLYLINANGFTNFKAAVDFVIRENVDIVLYSQVWTFGGEFDGKGFINEVVNKASAAGIIWINAAGNLGGQVWNGTVGKEEKVRLENKLDDNAMTLTLTWNDFNDSELVCATSDLDLELYDAKSSLIRRAHLIQAGVAPDPRDLNDGRSCYARESFSLGGLERGEYTIRVISKNAPGKNYRLILTDTKLGSFSFPEGHPGLEIMPPADNPSVFTVGEKTPFSAMGPTSDGRMKPDVVVENAQVAFTNGTQTAGSSNAAAMVAGAVALLKANHPSLSTQDLIKHVQSLRMRTVIPAGLVRAPGVPGRIQQLVPPGGSVRLDPGTRRLVILSHEHPLELPMLQRFNLRSSLKGDIVACMESMGVCRIFPVEEDYGIRPPFIEFRQYKNAGLMGLPGIWVMPRP